MTNPESKKNETSVVALKYDDKSSAPYVIAKGEGQLAQRILELAEENNVPLYQDAGLVGLLSRLDLDEEIPYSLYKAVADVLAFVYQINGKAPPSRKKKT